MKRPFLEVANKLDFASSGSAGSLHMILPYVAKGHPFIGDGLMDCAVILGQNASHPAWL